VRGGGERGPACASAVTAAASHVSRHGTLALISPPNGVPPFGRSDCSSPRPARLATLFASSSQSRPQEEPPVARPVLKPCLRNTFTAIDPEKAPLESSGHSCLPEPTRSTVEGK